MPAACKPPSLLLSWLRRCCEHMLYCECLLLTVVVPSDAGHAAQWWQVMTGATASSRLHALIIHPIMTHSQARGLHFHHNRTTPKTNPPLSGLNPLMPWLPWPRHPPEPSRSQLLYTRSAPCPGTPWPPACTAQCHRSRGLWVCETVWVFPPSSPTKTSNTGATVPASTSHPPSVCRRRPRPAPTSLPRTGLRCRPRRSWRACDACGIHVHVHASSSNSNGELIW